MNAPVTIKGWCPTALQPMMSGDGLLVRVRVRDATLTPAHANGLALASHAYGNGLIDLTQRANLQLRGVRPDVYPELLRELQRLQLLDMTDGADQAANVILSPLAGLDGTMAFDPRPIAAAIASGLRRDGALRDLPSKFGFAVDGGGLLPLGDLASDITVRAAGTGDPFHVSLDGSLHIACVDARDVADAMVRLASSFCTLRGAERRMRILVSRLGALAIFAGAGLGTTAVATAPAKSGRMSVFQLSASDGAAVIGVAAPFGAWAADALALLGSCAAPWPLATIRVTPWRTLLLAGIAADAAPELRATLTRGGLIVSADDPRLAIAACAGAPACSSAFVETRALAQQLAPFLPASGATQLHISGCAKGCAHPGRASLALVGTDSGYDLVQGGTAGDAPVLTGLAAAAAKDAIRARYVS